MTESETDGRYGREYSRLRRLQSDTEIIQSSVSFFFNIYVVW